MFVLCKRVKEWLWSGFFSGLILLFAKALLCAVSVVKGDRVHGGATTSRVQREIRVFLWLSMSVRIWQIDELFSGLSEFWKNDTATSEVQQQGLAAFLHCRNLAKGCFRKGTGSGVRKYIILADYRMFWTVMLIAHRASADWHLSSIFQSPDTVDSAFLSMA